MLLDESIVIGFMEASIVGAGLILAMYALIVPMAHRIFEEGVMDYNSKLKKFEELKNKITPESKANEVKQLNNLISEIKVMRKFPDYLGKGAVVTFFLYIVSIFIDIFWLIGTAPSSVYGLLSVSLFSIATFSFLSVGLGAIFSIYKIMVKEFEETTKKQKELGLNDFGKGTDSVSIEITEDKCKTNFFSFCLRL